MRFEPPNKLVVSRKNLRALLAKLDGFPEPSHATLVGADGFVLSAEEDEVHYEHESREGAPAGRMHPETEAALREETA